MLSPLWKTKETVQTSICTHDMAGTWDTDLVWLFALAPFWIIHAIPPGGIGPPAGSPAILSLGCWSKQPMLLASHGATCETGNNLAQFKVKLAWTRPRPHPDRTGHQVRWPFQPMDMDCWSSSCKQGHRKSDDDKSSSQSCHLLLMLLWVEVCLIFTVSSVLHSLPWIIKPLGSVWCQKISRVPGPAPMSWELHLAKVLDQSTGLLAQVNLHSQGSMLLLFFRALLFGGNGDETQIVFHGRCHASSTK